MEIEFNPNVTSGSAASQPVAKAGGVKAPQQDSASLGKSDALKAAINNISPVRPEKVDAAQAAVSDVKFPPDAMLKAIAALIAEKMQ